MAEAALYGSVEKWVKEHFGCWETGINKGASVGRIDVVGVRDVGGDLSGRSEVIAVEVKDAKPVFATAAGQAHGYSIMADRCYLAMPLTSGADYSNTEKLIAGRLGIGLVAIRGDRKFDVVLTAPPCEPIDELRLQVIEKLGLAHCSLCGTLFRRSEDAPDDFKGVVRQGKRTTVVQAGEGGKGYAWWLFAASGERDQSFRQKTYWRRYLCSDCAGVVAHLGTPRE